MPALADLNDLSLPDLWGELAATGLVRRLLELARDEDLGPGELRGDATARVASGDASPLAARLVVREPGVVAGLALGPLLCEVFADTLGESVRFEPAADDGDHTPAGATVATLAGPARAVVTIERTLLNLVGRLSGVATRTAAFVHAIEDTPARVLDTRKTTPGLRVLEKYAVRCGGGLCHRLGLYDAVLIKDNHVAGLDLDGFQSRIAEACRRGAGEREAGRSRFVEVEVDTPEQFERTLAIEPGLIDFVLLDNFTPAQLASAVARRDGSGSRILLEASGGITLDTVGAVARTGVDRISVGGLTHRAVSLDVGLDA
ncbi:MAG: carboxylating nicotinate-nucleotide diphosphorylase [Phycisphaerales bacterium JB040]